MSTHEHKRLDFSISGDMIEGEGTMIENRSGWKRLLAGLVLFVAYSLVHAGSSDEAKKIEDEMARGKEIYNQMCVVCHQSNGVGLSGEYPPLVDGAPFEADPSITEPLEKLKLYKDGVMTLGKDTLKIQIYVVTNGIAGTRMIGFGPLLSNEDIAALVTYIRNAWGNNMGDLVTPEQVEPLRR